jgi:taurine dioxygenase
MANSSIKINRIAGALGGEVSGVDLSQRLPEAVIAEIRTALLDNLVIFFRDQHLTPEQHLTFGHRFGELQIHDFVEGMAEHPQIIEVRKEPEEKRNFGGGWHTDVSYLERPALFGAVCARGAGNRRRHAVRQPVSRPSHYRMA